LGSARNNWINVAQPSAVTTVIRDIQHCLRDAFMAGLDSMEFLQDNEHFGLTWLMLQLFSLQSSLLFL
jgi:hypothetical protein